MSQDQSGPGTADPTARRAKVSAEGRELSFGRSPAVGQPRAVVKLQIDSAPELLEGEPWRSSPALHPAPPGIVGAGFAVGVY